MGTLDTFMIVFYHLQTCQVHRLYGQPRSTRDITLLRTNSGPEDDSMADEAYCTDP
jgi:hypothetical protein